MRFFEFDSSASAEAVNFSAVVHDGTDLSFEADGPNGTMREPITVSRHEAIFFARWLLKQLDADS